jgi:hypothetical protein
MTFTDDELNLFERIARQADCGVGWTHELGFHEDRVMAGNDLVAHAYDRSVGQFVATFDPPTILGLVRQLRQMNGVQG